jgi:mannose-1-phosphate guanylyltransferase
MQSSSNYRQRWAVILGGGEGMRLRPLTRLLAGDDRPKQFCRLVGEKTLLAQTRDRVARTIRTDRTLFVVMKSHEPFYTVGLAEVLPSRMVVQPSNRGTLPAILWSLMRVVRLDQEAVVAFFPSDHHYADDGRFMTEVASAFEVAEGASCVILLGAAATAPEVEYGWIEPEPMPNNSRLLKVRRFWEKPSYPVAQALMGQGCLWNTFVMVGRANAFLELIQSVEPHLYETFETAIARCRADMNPELMRAVYGHIETSDFSKRALSGATERLAVFSLGDIGWNDLGNPRRVSAMLPETGLRKPAGQALASEVLASVATAG